MSRRRPATIPENESVPSTSRRAWLRLFAGAAMFPLLARRASAAIPSISPVVLPVEKLLLDHPAESRWATHRRYRAHAFIHLFALPIFSRQDVGGGYAVVEQGVSGDRATLGLQFAGGSSGERTHGLNRVGLIQEAVLEQRQTCAEAAYFGFMVSSTEKSLDQGRKSLQTNTQGSIPYTAASGAGRAGHFRCTVSHLSVPARFNWGSFEQLTREMRSLLGTASDTSHFDVPLDAGGPRPDTFLYSVRRALLSKESKQTNRIVYNGKRYVLATEKQSDRKMGLQMEARGVTRKPDAIWRMNGTTTEMQTRQATTFEIWFEQGDPSGLPVRIEFYPKSFLKLVFEQQAGEEGPRFSYLMTPRNAGVQTSG